MIDSNREPLPASPSPAAGPATPAGRDKVVRRFGETNMQNKADLRGRIEKLESRCQRQAREINDLRDMLEALSRKHDEQVRRLETKMGRT